MKSVSVFCFSQYSDLLQALQSLPTKINILEMGTVHSGQFVLMCEDECTIASPHPTDSLVLTSVHPDLLKGYFKQLTVRAEKNLVCIEDKSLCHVLDAANTILHNSDFQLVEISRQPFPDGLATAIFANGTDPSSLTLLTKIRSVIISEPSSVLKKFF
jgi:hypothetical protein